VDEKSGVRAGPTPYPAQPLLPMTFDKTEKRTHDYVRHGTVNLFGALDVATGKVTGECYPRCGSEEFLAFMKTVAAQYVDREVHVVVDTWARISLPRCATGWPTIRTAPSTEHRSEPRGSTRLRSGSA
jgi:DDE superfamily endonuclease